MTKSNESAKFQLTLKGLLVNKYGQQNGTEIYDMIAEHSKLYQKQGCVPIIVLHPKTGGAFATVDEPTDCTQKA